MTPTQPDPESLIPLIQSLVWKRFSTVPPHVTDHDDLVQVGMEAVCKASQRWTPEGGAAFSNFAYQRAWGAIQDHLRALTFGGRYHHEELTVVSFDEPIGEDGLTRLDGYAASSGADDDFVDPFLRAGIEEAIGTTSLDAQSAWALIHEEGLNLREAGDAMGVSESRVCQWLSHVRRAIAEHPSMEGMRG